MELRSPTPVQSAAIPCALQGRDLVAIARTGSGKTIAYLVPLLVHVLGQPKQKNSQGPIALVIAPTRELCQQIHSVASKFAKLVGINVLPVFGGVDPHTLWQDLKGQSNEVMISTPGKLIEFLRKRAFQLSKCQFLVIDEADRMFDLGFEHQIRAIVSQTRPDRQTLFFSATFPRPVLLLSQDILNQNPVKITIGKDLLQGGYTQNEQISQKVFIIANYNQKITWLKEFIAANSQKQILVFANQIKTVQEISQDIGAAQLHGDMPQHERAKNLADFRLSKRLILVATGVAARGLDILSLTTVINFEISKTRDEHLHRIGRTGRGSQVECTAYTLVQPNQHKEAQWLIKLLREANQQVTQELLLIASVERGRHDNNSSHHRSTKKVDRSGIGYDEAESEERRFVSGGLIQATTQVATIKLPVDQLDMKSVLEKIQQRREQVLTRRSRSR